MICHDYRFSSGAPEWEKGAIKQKAIIQVSWVWEGRWTKQRGWRRPMHSQNHSQLWVPGSCPGHLAQKAGALIGGAALALRL
jgi:hypothetical protein